MIQLQVDFTLLNKFFGISLNKIPQYANKDLEEIMEIEAAQGNTKAENYKKILSDPDKLYEIFQLSNVENKFIILQNMSEGDIDDLLPLLEQDDLMNGLNFFTDEKLVTMCQHLPIEALADMMLQKFNLTDVLSLMGDDAMDKFIQQPDVDRKYAQEYFAGLQGEELKKILTKYLGPEFEHKSQKDGLQHLEDMNDSKYQQFILSLDRQDKMNMIDGIAAQNEDLVYLFENSDMVAPMNLLLKEDKVKLMGNLDKEFMIPMIEELPMDLTQIVLTQIDSREFSEILARDFQDILSSVVLFSTQMG
ncbi:MAG: hypothetical protein IJ877_03210 [Candidatus Gastranaerophilales bacterium]|nr:hypothetical protein [Candidatus Gastranaerophilales bacterium]